MVLPLVAVAAGSAIAGGAAAAFGKKRKAPKIDIAQLLQTIRSGATKQRDIASQASPLLDKRLTEFSEGTRGAFGQFRTEAEKNIDSGVQNLRSLRDVQGSELARTLQERAFRPVRAATDFVRQNLSSTGTGASQQLLAQPTLQASQSFQEGIRDLSSQILSGEIDLTNQANQQKLSLIEAQFGVEKGIFSTVLKFGNQADKDLIRELLSIQDQQTANELGVFGLSASSNVASRSADQRAAADRERELFGIGGNLLGTIFAGQGGQGGGGSSEVTDIRLSPPGAVRESFRAKLPSFNNL